tara:strand:+ start:135 stop:365 length:231 start_codon:yes stop_codon:yes gene_type:complete
MEQFTVTRYRAENGAEFDTASECIAEDAVLRRRSALGRRSMDAATYLEAKAITGRSAARASNILNDFFAWEYGDIE